MNENGTVRVMPTAIGPLTAEVKMGYVVRLSTEEAPAPAWEDLEDAELLDRLQAQLREYFLGKRTEFDLPIAPAGTEFQKTVWSALRAIPYGTTKTYGEIAADIGKPSASRAVGAACGKNPLLLLTPCHRVVGKDGSLTGFSAEGGVQTKEALLALERRHAEIQAKYEERVRTLLAQYPQLATRKKHDIW